MKPLSLIIAILIALVCCTKKQGKNPALAFTDMALLDSCKNQDHRYYQNNGAILLSGASGPHGTFKLRFNSVAFKALTNNGKLPVEGSFPEGSLVIKDVYNGNDISVYAFMYKRSGSWLWAEVKPDKQVLYSVNKNPSGCTGCHSQTGNRDLVVSFNFY
jgi:hypothetical protein